MIVQPMSDLHSDFVGFRGYPASVPGADLIVVAGDTRQGLVRALTELRAAYPPPLELVVVAGNHEFWTRQALPTAIAEGRSVATSLGAHYLEEGVAHIRRLRVLGCTLWSGYDLFGETMRATAMRTANSQLRDHKRIKFASDPWLRFRAQEARAKHLQSKAFLETELARSHDGPTIVVTHFAPIPDAVAPEHRGSVLSAAACSDLSPMIQRFQPDAWISGHTHFHYRKRCGRTLMMSNPLGYPDERLGFDAGLTIEVET
jgi:hypothetical protein